MQEHKTDGNGHVLLKFEEADRECVINVCWVPDGHRLVTHSEKATYKVAPECRSIDEEYTTWDGLCSYYGLIGRTDNIGIRSCDFVLRVFFANW